MKNLLRVEINRKTSNEPVRRVSKEFAKLLDEIKEMRIKIGKDGIDSIKTDWRLTLAMIRHPKFNEIKEAIINSDLA